MNEQIKLLAEQAGYLPDMFGIGHWDMPECQKFAELIVKECAEIALEQKKWVEDMKVRTPIDAVWNKARIQQSQHIVDKIKTHFGVEE
jgi:hypothetical protein